MIKRKKLWTSMQAAALAGIVTLEGCSSHSGTEGESGAEYSDDAYSKSYSTLGTEGEGEGEGEGKRGAEGEGEGEGEGKSSTGVNYASDDLAYLTQLSLMRGHLYVGYELFKAGHVDHAKTHMKHPESELYADIAPAFSKRGTAGFADELQALAQAVESDRSAEEVTGVYNALTKAMTSSESAVDGSQAAVQNKLQLVVNLLRVAGEEYAMAVVDGKMEYAHEYQDALGFTVVAGNIINGAESTSETEAAALEKTKAILSDLQDLWPSLVPPETLQTEASKLYGAASQVEILALGLK